MTDEYVELHCHSYYSLLDGASSPEALVERAAALGYPALALTDHDGLYGVVRFWRAARERDLKPIVGAEVLVEIPPAQIGSPWAARDGPPRAAQGEPTWAGGISTKTSVPTMGLRPRSRAARQKRTAP